MSDANAGAVPPQMAQGLEAALAHIAGGENFAAPAADAPANQPSNPAGGEAAQQAVPAAAPQVQSAPPLWQRVGYDSEESLERSVVALRSGHKQVADEATRLKQENEALRQQIGAARVTPQGFPQQVAPQDPLAELESTYGVPRNLLGGAMNTLVEQKINETLSPFVKAAQAEQAAVERYGPEYTRIKPALDAFVATNPEVGAMVNAARQGGLAELANDYALAKFREAYAMEQHARLTGAAGATEAATQQARAHAGVLTGRGAETRTQLAPGAPLQIDKAEAIARANAGDDSLLMKKATELLVPWSEDYLQGVMKGQIFMPGQL